MNRDELKQNLIDKIRQTRLQQDEVKVTFGEVLESMKKQSTVPLKLLGKAFEPLLDSYFGDSEDFFDTLEKSSKKLDDSAIFASPPKDADEKISKDIKTLQNKIKAFGKQPAGKIDNTITAIDWPKLVDIMETFTDVMKSTQEKLQKYNKLLENLNDF